MKISAKLTILCLTLVLFTAGILSFFADLKVAKTLKEEIAVSITQQSKGISSDIGRFMFSRLNDVRMAAKNPYLQSPNLDGELITQKLQELENLNNLYYSFSFFDKNRIRIADSKRLSIGKQHANDLYWKKLGEGQDAAVDVSQSESVGRVVMHFAATVEANEGVVVGRILVNELFKVVGDFSLSSDSSRRLDIHLINEEGTILYSNTNPAKILKETYSNYDLVKDIDQSGVTFLETDNDLFFVSKETNYLSFSGNDWTLVLSIPKDRAFAPLAQIRQQILYSVIPVLILSIVLALLAANFFVRPIVQLSKAAEEMGRGKLNTKISVKSNDEVGTLAKQLSKIGIGFYKKINEQRQLNKKLHLQKQKMENQKNQLEFFSSQIKDSISYAERIQRATLPPTPTLKDVFPESFVMYKPKDLIGGDFYWFEKVRKGNNEYMIIACADCTGHGVPGAIMSIMGSNQLTNIIYYQNYIDPKRIISRLDKVIKFELQRESDDETNRDGMEIGVCVIDLDTLKMEFAGVGIPLRLIKAGTNELTIFKSARMMVGGMEGDEQQVTANLKKEVIQLDPKDKIYLTSDGYQDQFGGEHDKKFMTKNFNKLLEENSDKPMEDQKKVLQETIKDWSKNTSQTDDIVVLGFEIK